MIDPLLYVDYDPSTGLLTWKYNDGTALASLENGTIQYAITPPAGAAKYKVCRIEAPNYSTDFTDGIIDDLNYSDEMKPINGNVIEIDYPFKAVDSDPDVTVYYPNIYHGTDFGAHYMRVFAWYDEDDNLLPNAKYSFWITQAEPFQIELRGENLSDETSPVTVPCFHDAEHPSWWLLSRHKPQYGENAYHVELELMDDNNEVQPTEQIVFYLPYPVGHDFNDDAEYTLKHYDPLFTQNGYVLTAVEKTPIGLKFMASSLSPFVLSWTGDESTPPTVDPDEPVVDPVSGQDAPALLKTGDQSPIGLWLTIMVLSAAAVVLMRRKTKA